VAKYDNTKGKAQVITGEGAVAMTMEEFLTLATRRGVGKRQSQYAPFVVDLKVGQPVEASFVFPKANIRTLRSAIVKEGKKAGYKVKTVLLDGHLVVARVE
jgi:hypothetical protein